jgi:hypothetical protein
VDELAYGLDLLLAPLEDTNLVCYRTLAKLVDSQGEVYDGGKLDWGKVITMRVYDETDLW